MHNFMDYIQDAWHASTGWDADNSYSSLTGTSRALLDFSTPVGVALHCSSLASRSFANSYSLANQGAVDGSLAYLYSSRPLLVLPLPTYTSQDASSNGSTSSSASPSISLQTHLARRFGYGEEETATTGTGGSGGTGAGDEDMVLPSRSPDIPLRSVIRGYRTLPDAVQAPEPASMWELWQGGRRIDRRDTLLYGRLYLPRARLEALYLRRLSPSSQVKVACVSSAQLNNGGSVLFTLQRDVGRHQTEYMYSTDGGLVGFRGLWNFGPHESDRDSDGDDGGMDVKSASSVTLPKDDDTWSSSSSTTTASSLTTSIPSALESVISQAPTPLPNGRFSAGGELYYGALNKTGGMSVGCRFATLPRHPGFPYTMTLTLNPLMGNLSSTYAVRAGPALALATRFDFNVYSYESEFQVGFELWKRKQQQEADLPDSGDTDSSTWGAASSALAASSVQWAIDKLRESERRGWISNDSATRDAAGKMLGGLQPEDAGVPDDTEMAIVTTERSDSGYSVTTVGGSGRTGLGPSVEPLRDEDTAGVLKARVNQHGVLGVLWEGRVKQLLYTFGLHVDFQQREQIFRGVGVEFHYSS